MRQVEVPAGHGQCVEVAHRFGRSGPERTAVFAEGQAGDLLRIDKRIALECCDQP